MEDSQIVDLYWSRNEEAIAETSRKYGTFCQTVAMNILSIREDAEECVNDTWHQAWNTIPPQRPMKLRYWLGRIVRNIAINLWNHNHAKKRYDSMEQMLDELEDCVPSPVTVERIVESEELGYLIGAWLDALPQEDRIVFVRRYWHGTALNRLAVERKIAPEKLAQKMYRMRLSLKAALEKEGIEL